MNCLHKDLLIQEIFLKHSVLALGSVFVAVTFRNITASVGMGILNITEPVSRLKTILMEIYALEIDLRIVLHVVSVFLWSSTRPYKLLLITQFKIKTSHIMKRMFTISVLKFVGLRVSISKINSNYSRMIASVSVLSV